MNRVLVVYDDSNPSSEEVRAVVGCRRFGEVLIGRQTVQTRMRAFFASALPEETLFTLVSAEGIATLRETVAAAQNRAGAKLRVLHFFSDAVFRRREAAELVLKNASFAERVYKARQNGHDVFYAFPGVEQYEDFLERAEEAGSTRLQLREDEAGEIHLLGDEFLWIGAQEGLVTSLTGKYDARYFNNLIIGEDTVTKSSCNVEKLRAEFRFWQLLPDEMKIWFVMPFDFQEDGKTASYRMERLYLPNLAVKFVHGAMDGAEFESFLQRYFRFLRARTSRLVTKEAYAARAEKLYVTKTRERLDALKADPKFAPIAALIQSGTPYPDVDAAFERFLSAYRSVMRAAKPAPCEVIGHGDACMSNILFDRASRTMKLIDPKGARTEEELWTDPYYDLCKLSHSVLGLYDFFNSGMYELSLDEELHLRLLVPFDNAKYAAAFKQHMEEDGFDYRIVRIGEAALFLSMMPLHMDNPHKALGFFLNAMRILDELERE